VEQEQKSEAKYSFCHLSFIGSLVILSTLVRWNRNRSVTGDSIIMAKNQAAVKAQFARLESVDIFTPVTEVLGALGPELKQHRKAYVSLAAQIHPDRGGNFDKLRGTACMKIISRAMEQSRAAAEHASWDGASCDFNPDPAFNVPETLLYTEQPSAQEKEMLHHLQQVEEAQARAAGPEVETINISDSSSESECGSPYQGDEADEDDKDDSETDGGGGEDTVPLMVGDMVITVGLVSTSFNGRVGIVRSGLEDSRYKVELSPDYTAPRKFVRMKPENLRIKIVDPARAMEAVLFVPCPQPTKRNFPEYEAYPQYDGDPSDIRAMSDHALEAKSSRRKQVQRRAKQVASEKAKEYANLELEAANAWHPPDISDVPQDPAIGTVFGSRWEAEMSMRSYAASIGAQGGILISKSNVKITGSCPFGGCKFVAVADLQPSNGTFKLNKVRLHNQTCFGLPTPVDGASFSDKASSCKSAYTSRQAARRFQSHLDADPSLTAKQLGEKISLSRVYLRFPGKEFFRAVHAEMTKVSMLRREIEMAALPGMAAILAAYGHKVGTIDIARYHLAM